MVFPMGISHSRWNILDFMIVIFSIAGIILDLVHNAMKVSVKPIVLRSLRVLRIIRGIVKIFSVIFITTPWSFNPGRD